MISVPQRIETESDLIAAAVALGALRVPDLSAAEKSLAAQAGKFSDRGVEDLARAIRRKGDPLGATLFRSPC